MTTWKKIVSRPTEPLTVKMILDGGPALYEKTSEKFLFRWKAQIVSGIFEVFVDLQSIKDCGQALMLEHKRNPNFFKEMIAADYMAADLLVEVAREAGKDAKKISDGEIIKRLERYKNAFYKFVPGMVLPFPIEAYLTQKLTESLKSKFPSATEQQVQDYFRILTVAKKESDILCEQRELLKIKVEKDNGKDVAALLEKHAEKFGYIGLTNSFLSEPWGKDYFENIVNKIENAGMVINKVEQNRKNDIADYKKFAGELDSTTIETANLLHEYMFFRAYRIDAMKKAQWHIKPLLKEVCKRHNVNFEDLIYFFCDEIIDILESKNTPDFEPRKKYLTIKFDGTEVSWNTSPIAQEKIDLPEKISGQVACKGFAEGTVKIINSSKDSSKFLRGDILVTAMTTPDLVGLMEKAAAIITDEGGILCHAAIVSRELGIPCIIGTQVATKVLKDGDKVRVDAEKGVVEKI